MNSIAGAHTKELVVNMEVPAMHDDVHNIHFKGNSETLNADIVGFDERHDLALLKLRQSRASLSRLKLNTERPPDGLAIAVSGYPLNELVLVTTSGNLASSESMDVRDTQVPGLPTNVLIPDIAESFLADMTANPGNSGGPVYSLETAEVIGVCVGGKMVPMQDEQGNPIAASGHQLRYFSGLTIVVPAKYVAQLLKAHNLNF
jgi:S1-C subfamily serine protease